VSVVLRLEDLTRRFPGVVALDDVSFDLHACEVHALVGENGAGKSTLINIIAGVLQPDAGQVLLDDQPANLTDPVTARKKGIVAVHQEAELFETLSVAENMALCTGLPTAAGLVSWREVNSRARRAVAPLAVDLDVRQHASRLSVAERHLTQVAAAIAEKPRIIILDEPTSVLTAAETQWLFARIHELRAAGVGIVYISHRQEEIFQLADRISVLRDGRLVWTGPPTEIEPSALVAKMVGRAMDKPTPPARAIAPAIGAPPRMRLLGLTDRHGRFHDISLDLAAREVFGLYGLVGAGRSELAQAIFGLRGHSSCSIELDGHPRSINRPMDAVAERIAYLPEDRLRQAVCRGLSVRDNVVLSTLSSWGTRPFVSRRREDEAARRQTTKLHVRMRSLDEPVRDLSGGNQQKVVLARLLLAEPRVLILDEPTRGVDVAAKAEIHGIIRELADSGCAVLMISSELNEILAHTDRIGVLREGRLVLVVHAEETSAVELIAAALPKSDDATPGHLHHVRRPSRRPRLPWLSNVGLAVAVALLASALAVTTEGRFLTAPNLGNLLDNLSSRAVLALAAAAVIIAGGIDISIGSLLALAAAIGGTTIKALGGGGDAIALGIVAGLAAGTAGGLFNASLSLAGRVHPIVVTLGTMTIFRGLLTTITGGNVLAGLPQSFGSLATHSWLGLKGSTWVLMAGAAGAYLWLSHSRSGRHVYAIGCNTSAARFVGISRTRTWLTAYGVAGFFVGLAGMLELAQNRTMQPTMAIGYELRAICAAVIGGVAITGGRGSVVGVLLGALLLTMIENGLVLWQVSGAKYELVIGGLLLPAVLLDRLLRSAEP